MIATYCGVLKRTINGPAVWVNYAEGEKRGIVGEYLPAKCVRGRVYFAALGRVWWIGQLNQDNRPTRVM